MIRDPLLASSSSSSNYNWNTFVSDEKTQSYSYHLPHNNNNNNNNSSSWISKSQLDEWFNMLHPNNFDTITKQTTTTTQDNNNNNEISWTEASYKGVKLLRQTAWVVFDSNCKCEYGYSDTWQQISNHPKFVNIVKQIADTIFPLESTEKINCCNLNYYPEGGGVGFHADDEYLFDGLNRPTYILSLSLCGRGSGNNNNGSDGQENIGGGDKDTPTPIPTPGSRLFQIQPKSGRTEDQVASTTSVSTAAAAAAAAEVLLDGDDDNTTNNNNINNNNNIKSILLQHGDIITMEGMFQKYYFHSVWPGDSMDHKNHPLTSGERINLTFRTIVQHLNGDKEECRGITCPLSSSSSSAKIGTKTKCRIK